MFYHFLQITKIFPNSTQTLLVSFDTYNPAILKFKKNVIYVTQFKWIWPINPSVWLVICSIINQSTLFCILNWRILMQKGNQNWHATCFSSGGRRAETFTSFTPPGNIFLTVKKHRVMQAVQKICFRAWSFEMIL